MRVDKSKWEKVKLGKVCEVISGATPKTNVAEYWSDSGHLWITPAELDGTKYVGSTARHITDFALQHTHLTEMPVGTVLLSSRAPIGKVAITTDVMYCNQGFKNLVCTKSIYNEFLYFYLTSQTERLNYLGNGVTFKEISKKTVSDFSIFLPPLFEQRAIAEELDGIQSMIGKCREQLEDYDRLARSIFHEMFGDPVRNDKGWEVKKLKGLFINRDSERVPLPSSYRKDHKGIYDYYGACGVIDSIDDFIFDEKLLLIGEDGANLVTCSKPNAIIASGKYWVNNHAHVLQCTNCIDIVYACYAFNYIDISSYITGVAQPKLNQSNLNKIAIPLPPLPLQQKFAERIEAIEKMKEATKAQLADLQQLFDSRMQYYFS